MASTEMAPYTHDDCLLRRARETGLHKVQVYRHPGTAVVLGRGGDPDRELKLSRIEADRVPLLRRRGGGCAVVLDSGNLVVSLACSVPGIGGITSSFAAISQWLSECLAACGVSGIEQRGISDLVLGRHKVGGSCIYRTRGLLHYGSTLLVNPDLELMERYLRHPPREPDYRQGRRHRDFVTTLAARGLADDSGRLAARLSQVIDVRLPELDVLLAEGRSAA